MDPKVTTGLAGGLDSVNLIRQQRDAAADRGVLVIERAVQGHQPQCENATNARGQH